jgi:WD40 repeat protein
MAERENMMKQCKWLILFSTWLLIMLVLNGCTFSVEVLPTSSSLIPTSTHTSVPPTFTPVAPTSVVSFPTPTLISIRLDTLSLLEIFTSFGEGEFTRSVAFTFDGKVLASAGGNNEDFAIRLWDVAGGQSILKLDGHTGIVWGLAFSPDGQMLASVSSDATAKIWDWRNGTLIQSLDFPAEVVSVSFSPDGRILAVGGVDEPQGDIQNAAIWTFSVSSWQPLLKFPEYWNIEAMVYSPDGRWLIGGGTSRNVKVWRTGDGTSVFTLSHAHQVLDAAVSPDGSIVATATCQVTVNEECTEGGVWLWNLSNGRLLNKLRGFPDVVESVSFSVDGSSMIAASRNGTMRVYATSDFQQQFEATPPGGNGIMTPSPDGGLLATGGNNGVVHLWKVVYRP